MAGSVLGALVWGRQSGWGSSPGVLRAWRRPASEWPWGAGGGGAGHGGPGSRAGPSLRSAQPSREDGHQDPGLHPQAWSADVPLRAWGPEGRGQPALWPSPAGWGPSNRATLLSLDYVFIVVVFLQTKKRSKRTRAERLDVKSSGHGLTAGVCSSLFACGPGWMC